MGGWWCADRRGNYSFLYPRPLLESFRDIIYVALLLLLVVHIYILFSTLLLLVHIYIQFSTIQAVFSGIIFGRPVLRRRERDQLRPREPTGVAELAEARIPELPADLRRYRVLVLRRPLDHQFLA